MRTRTQIAIRTSRLDFCDILFAQAELLVDSEDELPDRKRGHAICVVRDTAESGSRLACREGLPPPICPTLASVDYDLLDYSLPHKRNDHVLAAQSIISAVPSEECIKNTEITNRHGYAHHRGQRTIFRVYCTNPPGAL